MEHIQSLSKKKNAKKGSLFLKGVFKSDCMDIEDIFKTRLNLNYTEIQEDTITYDTIPHIFTGMDTWIKSTNLHCWFCHQKFITVPWFEPQSIEPDSQGLVGNFIADPKTLTNEKSIYMIPNGIFCSCNCVQAYINLHSKTLSERYNRTDMLYYLYEIFYNKKPTDIRASDPPQMMKKYGGGDLTNEDYKNRNRIE